ncbi:MAG: UvrD-helicase domain-containing protein [Bacteroides sp.]|nr:MAG: UvrD-helicase domain-containing protein [Bacteroides sp.]
MLSNIQKKIINTINGVIIVIAGAGSGKTRVITHRIANMISSHKINPNNILSITFTNKAANEMKDRIYKLVGDKADDIWIGTFHSIFNKILHIEHKSINIDKNFTIYDKNDSLNLIKDIVKKNNFDIDKYKPSVILNKISDAKNKGISYEKYILNQDIQRYNQKYMISYINNIYHDYSKRCFLANAIDFDDILLKVYELFHENNNILEKYQNIFKYISVDEYQDTNLIQDCIVKKIAKKNQNICIVGDDSQSIYSFRGALISNILNLQDEYPNLIMFKMEENYRSTQNIVNASNNLIKKNNCKLRKNIYSCNENGNKIRLFIANDCDDESRIIAISIKNEIRNYKYNYSDFSILYRNHFQSKSFEKYLALNSIPYEIYKGKSVYENQNVKNIIAYYRFLTNRNDEEAFKTLIKNSYKGLGKTFIENIIQIIRKYNVPLWEVITNKISKNSKIINFVKNIEEIYLYSQNHNVYEVTLILIKKDMILLSDNIEDFLLYVKEYSNKNNNNLLKDFLVDEIINDNINNSKNSNKVSLMTIHASKGLEFNNVYIPGMENNIFPSQFALNDISLIEEERRLFYVAITRAKKKVFLSYAKKRYINGKSFFNKPSIFIRDLA